MRVERDEIVPGGGRLRLVQQSTVPNCGRLAGVGAVAWSLGGGLVRLLRSGLLPWGAGLALMATGGGVFAQAAPAAPMAVPALGTSYALEVPVVRAQVAAARQAVLSSELPGKLLKLPFREGDSFKAGDVLAEFDCSLHRARLSRSTAAESSARQQLNVANRLDALNSISVSDLAQARSAVSVGQAESAVERAMVQRCTIKAPFAGRVGETHVRVSEYLPEGKELLSIYETGSFEVEMIVPSRWLVWLRPGYPFAVLLDETGQAHTGEIVRIAGSVDPVSQSVRVIGRLGADEQGLLPGMSGTVSIEPPGTELGSGKVDTGEADTVSPAVSPGSALLGRAVQ